VIPGDELIITVHISDDWQNASATLAPNVYSALVVAGTLGEDWLDSIWCRELRDFGA
jgi:hypothetical protein